MLTGETGAGKSILVDALQLALGSRGDAGVVREGAARAEISAEFDAPPSLRRWLDEAGFEAERQRCCCAAPSTRRARAAPGSTAAPATVAQLREAADHLVDIHGQHAWQSLTRAAPPCARCSTRYAGIDTAAAGRALGALEGGAPKRWPRARAQQADLERERERLAWQIGEVDKLAPGADEWDELNAEHTRLANAQSLIEARAGRARRDRRGRRRAPTRSPAAPSTRCRRGRALRRRGSPSVVEVLQGAQAQLQDAAHTLARLSAPRPSSDPQRLAELDERLSAWMAWRGATGARRPNCRRCSPQWKDELRALDAASRPRRAAKRAERTARERLRRAKRGASPRRAAQAAPQLAQAVTQAMQQLGMAGGRFEVALLRAGRAAVVRPGVGRVPGRRPRRQHAAAAGARWPRAASCRASRWPSPSPPASCAARRAPAR